MKHIYIKGLKPRELAEYTAALILLEKTHERGLSEVFFAVSESGEISAIYPDDVYFSSYLYAAANPEIAGRMLAAAFQRNQQLEKEA